MTFSVHSQCGFLGLGGTPEQFIERFWEGGGRPSGTGGHLRVGWGMDSNPTAPLTEGEARIALAEALENLADTTVKYVQGFRASRVDVYLAEARVHQAQATLQRVLAAPFLDGG